MNTSFTKALRNQAAVRRAHVCYFSVHTYVYMCICVSVYQQAKVHRKLVFVRLGVQRMHADNFESFKHLAYMNERSSSSDQPRCRPAQLWRRCLVVLTCCKRHRCILARYVGAKVVTEPEGVQAAAASEACLCAARIPSHDQRVEGFPGHHRSHRQTEHSLKDAYQILPDV